jgi:hypothetical protein
VAVERLEDRTAPALFTVGSPTTVGVLNNFGCVATGDFNGDTKTDIVMTNYGLGPPGTNSAGNTIVVKLGNGDGTFNGGSTISVGSAGNAQYVSYVAVGDLNGDGIQDLAVVSNSEDQSGNLTIFLGNGSGGFTKSSQLAITGESNTSWVGIAKMFTGDPHEDIVVCGFGLANGTGNNNIVIFQGDGKGNFALNSTVTNGQAFVPNALALGDFNNDGSMDIAAVTPGVPGAVGQQTDGFLDVFLGNGSGQFTATTSIDTGGYFPIGVSTADFNGDGKLDLVIANAGDDGIANGQSTNPFGTNSNVAVMINTGGGNFTSSNLTAGIGTGGSQSVFAVTAADYNLDGKQDIAAVLYGDPSGANARVLVYMGNGSGGFTADANSPYNTGTTGGQYLATDDFNHDTVPDLVVVTAASTMDVLLNTTTPAAATTTSMTAADVTPSPSTYDDAVTLKATVTSGGGTPTGTVTFLDGTTSIGTGTLNASGVATFTTGPLQLAAGSHAFTAHYVGAPGFAASTSSPAVAQTVNKANTTATLTSASPNPVTQGGSVTFTATVTGPGAPTGTVNFLDSGASIGTSKLVNVGGTQTATLTVPTTSWLIGDHKITVQYADQANWIGSVSLPFTLTVNAPASVNTTTVVGSTLNPSMATQQVTLVATVGATSGIPTGAVNFFDAGVPIGSAPLSTVGTVQQAMLPISTLAIGSHQITAQYVGTAGFNPSTSPAITQVVNSITTTVSVISSGSPSLATKPVTFTAVVGAAVGAATGTVSFFDGTTFIGSGTLSTVGGQQVATVTATGLAVGPHTITAQYAAQGNFAGSNSAPITQAVNAVGTGVTASSGLNPATAGQTVMFTATVIPVATISLLPTGTVTFLDGATALATVPVTGATASFSTSTLSVGAHSITAAYSGDTNYTASTSPAVAETINPTSPPPPPPPSPLLVGYREFGVGAGAGTPATVRFFNPDGSERFSLDAFPGFTGGVRTAAADFNGDGIADLVVGTGPGGPSHVRVIDGVTQKELFSVDPFEATFTGGVYVAAGDVNGDGVPDLVITPDEGGGPRVRIFSGKAGFAQLDDFFGIDDTAFRGGARAAVGDINGDGFGDLVVAAGFLGGPRVAAFSGKSLGTNNRVKLFADFFAFESTLRNGAFVTVGDIDGDGRAELIAGGGPGGGPRVTAFSGSSLMVNAVVPVANFFAGNTDNRGGIRLAVKNLDNDNLADLVVGDGTDAGSRVTSYFGKVLRSPSTPPSDFSFDAFPGFTGGVYVG